ncbi:MAG: 3-isopropylmalate dehydratase small subunit [bacterium]|nr:3-isopropylmalate dehydratase small subunit [bacterium]
MSNGSSFYRGLVVPLDRSDIDTDQIMPKQFLKRTERTGYGEFVFYEWRYNPDGTLNKDFILNKEEYKGASILVTGPNFGTGSSREHAVWGLVQFGFKAVIAPSFGDIFYSNAIENGLWVIKVKDTSKLIQNASNIKNYYLNIDLEKQIVYDDYNYVLDFEIDNASKLRLIKGWDNIDLVLQFEEKIKEYEKNRFDFYPSTDSYKTILKF